jgi:hypothetical protein
MKTIRNADAPLAVYGERVRVRGRLRKNWKEL